MNDPVLFKVREPLRFMRASEKGMALYSKVIACRPVPELYHYSCLGNTTPPLYRPKKVFITLSSPQDKPLWPSKSDMPYPGNKGVDALIKKFPQIFTQPTWDIDYWEPANSWNTHAGRTYCYFNHSRAAQAFHEINEQNYLPSGYDFDSIGHTEKENNACIKERGDWRTRGGGYVMGKTGFTRYMKQKRYVRHCVQNNLTPTEKDFSTWKENANAPKT